MNTRKTTAHGRKRESSVKCPTLVKQLEEEFQLEKRLLSLVNIDAGGLFTLGILLGFAISADFKKTFQSLMASGKTIETGSKKTKSRSSSAASKKKNNWQDPEDLCDADD